MSPMWLFVERGSTIYNGKETSQSLSKLLFFMSTDKSLIPISDFCHYNAMRESPKVVGKKNVPQTDGVAHLIEQSLGPRSILRCTFDPLCGHHSPPAAAIFACTIYKGKCPHS